MRVRIVFVIVGVAIVVAILAARSGGSHQYRVAAIFDDAQGMVPGEQVKIAGAVVGEVQAVRLAPGPKARIVMTIEGRFAPFHADATCSILPEGLISENFVECTPGSHGRPLAPAAGGVPTVPLSSTTDPVSLQDVLNVFSVPTDQRVAVLIADLGIATAGRGEDLQALLRRADPALEQSQRALSILDAQRTQLTTAVGQTADVVGDLARRQSQVREFVDQAAILARTTARHRVPLGEAIRRLPAMLAAVRPGVRSLDVAVANTTPLLKQLRVAAPGLRRLTLVLPQFVSAGTPAVKTLGAAAERGVPAARKVTPVLARLSSLTGPLRTLSTGLDALLVSSRDTGALEGLERFAYVLSNNTSLYDNVSHIITFMATVAPECIAGQEAGLNVTGCAHTYRAAGAGEVPINEPSCGAKSGAWWNETCPPPTPGPIAVQPLNSSPTTTKRLAELGSLDSTALSGGVPSVQRLSSLLEYLLK
jgi:virulence factor Mce-like protein